MLFSHGEDGALTGHFGFGTEYQNWLTVFGKNLSVTLRRAFTTPPDMPAPIDVQSGNTARRIEVPPADSFAAFLSAVFQAIRDNRLDAFAGILGSDATLRERLGEALPES